MAGTMADVIEPHSLEQDSMGMYNYYRTYDQVACMARAHFLPSFGMYNRPFT